MNDKFFILGMPRSRTYWMSVFFGGVHEGAFYFTDYRDFLKSDIPCDCTTAYMMIRDHLAGQKKVIIHRDIADVRESVLNVLGDIDTSFLEELQDALRREDGLHVDFDDIDNRIEEIWAYCKKEPFPRKRYLALKDEIMDNDFMIMKTKELLQRIDACQSPSIVSLLSGH